MNRFEADSPEQQAEKAVNEQYRQLQPAVTRAVRRRLASRKMLVDESDLEEAYCLAWHGVCETIKRGTQVSNLTGMLIEITWRRAVDAYREQRSSQRAELDLEEITVELDLDAHLDDQIKLKRLITQVRSRLNPRECEAISLCVIHGYSRAEAAQLMGLQRRQMEKLMDGATKKIGGIVASIATRGCGGDEWARLMRGYALGLIAEDDRDYPRAAEHVAQCAVCRRYVNGLRGLAAILPPVLPFAPVTNAGHGAGILAHLGRVFRGGHNGGRMASTEGVLRTAGAGAASGGGGGSLASSLSAGTIAKGVVAVAVGAAALTLATHRHNAHHTRARQPAPATAHAQIPPGAISGPPAASLHSPAATPLGQDAHHTHAHRPVLAQRTYVLTANKRAAQGTQNGPSQPAHTVTNAGDEDAYSSPTPSTQPPPAEDSANAAAVNKEFGWER
jgi:RNA polymerase sigma factor (sigma-70 family)